MSVHRQRDLDNLAVEINQAGEIKIGNFRLKSGKMSPIYVDARGLISHPGILARTADLLVPILRELKFDRIAGIPDAGNPIASAVVVRGNIPGIYIRRNVKDYGTQKVIEGHYEPGMRVALIDNVITDGGSKDEFIDPLNALGLQVTDVVVLVDREQGGREALARRGINLHSAYTLRRFVDSLGRRGAISAEDLKVVMAYLDNPDSYQPPAQ